MEIPQTFIYEVVEDTSKTLRGDSQGGKKTCKVGKSGCYLSQRFPFLLVVGQGWIRDYRGGIPFRGETILEAKLKLRSRIRLWDLQGRSIRWEV